MTHRNVINTSARCSSNRGWFNKGPLYSLQPNQPRSCHNKAIMLLVYFSVFTPFLSPFLPELLSVIFSSAEQTTRILIFFTELASEAVRVILYFCSFHYGCKRHRARSRHGYLQPLCQRLFRSYRVRMRCWFDSWAEAQFATHTDKT